MNLRNVESLLVLSLRRPAGVTLLLHELQNQMASGLPHGQQHLNVVFSSGMHAFAKVLCGTLAILLACAADGGLAASADGAQPPASLRRVVDSAVPDTQHSMYAKDPDRSLNSVGGSSSAGAKGAQPLTAVAPQAKPEAGRKDLSDQHSAQAMIQLQRRLAGNATAPVEEDDAPLAKASTPEVRMAGQAGGALFLLCTVVLIVYWVRKNQAEKSKAIAEGR